jgi:CRISPR-associated protein Csm2
MKLPDQPNAIKRRTPPRLDHNKRTQIRKFYDEVVRLNAAAKANPEDWDTILPFINMLIAKAAYANGRNKLVTDEFVRMLKDCITQVQKPADLDVFASFFESFMGFYRKFE